MQLLLNKQDLLNSNYQLQVKYNQIVKAGNQIPCLFLLNTIHDMLERIVITTCRPHKSFNLHYLLLE